MRPSRLATASSQESRDNNRWLQKPAVPSFAPSGGASERERKGREGSTSLFASLGRCGKRENQECGITGRWTPAAPAPLHRPLQRRVAIRTFLLLAAGLGRSGGVLLAAVRHLGRQLVRLFAAVGLVRRV